MQKYKRNPDAIDYSQNRYEDLNALHKHPYDPQLLEEVREDYLKPRTCREFMDWLDTHPHYDTVAEASSQYIRGTSKSDSVWNCAKINTDWKAIMEKVSVYANENRIDEDFNTDYTEEWRTYDLGNEQESYVPFRHNSELDNQRLHGFKKQYQLIEVTLTDLFPELKAVENLFDMQWVKTDLNYQPTSGANPRHVDFLTTQLKMAMDNDPAIANARYNPLTKHPEGWQLKRILIGCDNWYPGQLFGFEEHNWANWEAGDAIDFNWQHCRHFTSNSGYNARPLLKITGIVPENHWLVKKEFRSFTL